MTGVVTLPTLVRFVSRNHITDRWLQQNPDAVIECWNCSKPIQKYDPRQKYCDSICKKRYWRAIRKEILYYDCKWCGDEFEAKRKDTFFCSKKCINSSYRQRKGIPIMSNTKIGCGECGTQFLRSHPPQKYCSFRCFMIKRMRNKRIIRRGENDLDVEVIEVTKDDVAESIANIKKSGIRSEYEFDAQSWSIRAKEAQRRILEKYATR